MRDPQSGGGTPTLQISHPGPEPHRRHMTLATAPVDAGDVRLEFRPAELDAVTAGVERVAVELRSGALVVNTRASAAAGGSIGAPLRTAPGVELDAHRRISMRGSTGALVLMNGRRIALTGDALVASLRQMRAAGAAPELRARPMDRSNHHRPHPSHSLSGG